MYMYVWSAEQGKLIFPCPRSRLRIWSRETGSAVPSRVSLPILYTQAESGAHSRNSSRLTRGRPFIYLRALCAIGSVPTFSGHAIAYRWRSPPKVRRHRASSPQGSSSNECCLFAGYHGPINVRLSFSTSTILLLV